jgi:excisionase family DNA binding protein
MTSKLLTIREVAQVLNLTEKEVIEFAQSGVIPAYKVGGIYLRFKREQLEEVRSRIKPNQSLVAIEGTTAEKILDFVYHNDFYLVSLIVILSLLYFIVRL